MTQSPNPSNPITASAQAPGGITPVAQEPVAPGKKSHTWLIVGIVMVFLVICCVVAGIAFIIPVTLNPAKNFQDTRNIQRQSDVRQILNAVTQYASEQGHELSDLGSIPQCPATAKIGTSGVDLTPKLINEGAYIVGIPMDPGAGTFESSAADTGYTICTTTQNRVKIEAPYAEGGEEISVQR